MKLRRHRISLKQGWIGTSWHWSETRAASVQSQKKIRIQVYSLKVTHNLEAKLNEESCERDM